MSTASIPIYSQQETFYVPSIELKLSSRDVDPGVIRDVMQVTYRDSVNEIDSFTIEMNNWDADARAFKYVPPLNPSQANGGSLFDPGTKVELWMGYQNFGNMRRMMMGEITGLEPNFPESGGPTLTLTGLNGIHQLRGEQHTYSWNGDKTDTEIAVQLGNWPVRSGQPGLGIPVWINPASDEIPDAFVFMNNQYDIVFLLERARRRGYEVYLEDDETTGKQALYFGLSENRSNAPTYKLEWGRSLLSFKPTLSTACQVGKVTVRGWDRTQNKAIEYSYTVQDLWKDQGKSQSEISRQGRIAQAYGNRTEVVTKPPVRNLADAKKLAKATLSDQSKRLIEASGATIGLPDLRAGCMLEIAGFGKTVKPDGTLADAASDFDGSYYVTETTHTIGANGYRTEFKARREDQAGTQGASSKTPGQS